MTGGSGEEGETADLGETGEVDEAGEFSGELLEAGGVTGELCEGAAGAEVSGWMPAPARWSSKHKKVMNMVGGGKAGRLEEGVAAADSSDSEASVSDCCEIFHTQIRSVKQTVPCKNV